MKSEKYTKYLLISVIILTIVVVCTYGLSYAKYVSNKVFNYYLSSKGFYFESDNLSINKENNTDTSWNGDSIKFNIKNNSNEKLASGYDIKYKVTCKIEEENTTKKCYLNGTNNSEIIGTMSSNFGCSNYTNKNVDVSKFDEKTCLNNKYTWEAKPTHNDLFFDVVDTNNKEITNAVVTITATSISPYKKTLTGKYILTKDQSQIGTLSKEHVKQNDYEKLTITNSYKEDKCIKLTWNNSDILYDNKNNKHLKLIEDNNKNITGIIFNLENKNSINYIFYNKNKSKNITVNDFQIVESTECK